MEPSFDIKSEIDKETAAIGAANGLSPQEMEFLAPTRIKPKPIILETDATVSFGDREFGVTLRARGVWHRAYSGRNADGEHVSPEEPAHYDVASVTISCGDKEVEIWEALDEEAISEIALAAAAEE